MTGGGAPSLRYVALPPATIAQAYSLLRLGDDALLKLPGDWSRTLLLPQIGHAFGLAFRSLQRLRSHQINLGANPQRMLHRMR